MTNPLVPVKNPRFKWVLRLDTPQRHFRLFRMVWERGTFDGRGYSVKFSVGVECRWFYLEGFNRDRRCWKYDWRVTLLGLRLHYARSYGGRFA